MNALNNCIMITLDADKIRKEFPKGVEKATARLLSKSSMLRESLGPYLDTIVSLSLITRSTCIEFLDSELIYVTVYIVCKDGNTVWRWAIGEDGGGDFSQREQAETAGIYDGFRRLEETLT
jgi:hypothetical protein